MAGIQSCIILTCNVTEPMKGITLREAIQSDQQFVNDLTRETMRSYVEDTWLDEESCEHYYAINSFKQLSTQIICKYNEPIGRITLAHNKNEVIVDAIHLVATVQGQGLGSKLLNIIIEDAVKQEKSVSLIVLKSNPAWQLYKRLGFLIYEETTERYYMRLTGVYALN